MGWFLEEPWLVAACCKTLIILEPSQNTFRQSLIIGEIQRKPQKAKPSFSAVAAKGRRMCLGLNTIFIVGINTILVSHLGNDRCEYICDLERGQTGARTDGRTDGRKVGRTNGRTDGQTNGRTHGRTDARTGGRTGGRTDGRAAALILPRGAKGQGAMSFPIRDSGGGECHGDTTFSRVGKN